MGTVTALPVSEQTLHAATVAFLRANWNRRFAVDHLYDLLVDLDITNEAGQPALFTADESQRQRLYVWLLEHTNRG